MRSPAPRAVALSLAALLACAMIPAGSFAAFEDTGAAARAIGMGNAFTALADDAQAGYYNPAGLALVERPHLISSYGRLHMGLDDGSRISSGFLGWAQPAGRLGGLGVSWTNMSLTGDYTEHAFRLSWGRDFGERWTLGSGFNYMMIKVGQDEYTALDPVFNYGAKGSVSGLGLDAGALYKLLPNLRAGMAVKDLNRPDLGFGGKARQPVGLKLGVAYTGEALNAALDVLYRDRDVKVYAGVEKAELAERFAVRGGLGLGNREYANLSFGLGFVEKRFKADYAFLYPLSGLGAAMGTHRLALTIMFGAPPEKPPPPEVVIERDRVTELAEELKQLKSHIKKLETAPRPAPKPRRRRAKPKKGPPPPAWPKRHVVKRGDNLRSLAVQYYGDSKGWIDIYKANRRVIGPEGDLPIGRRIIIPKR